MIRTMWTGLALLASMAQARPSMVAVPLELDPHPALTKAEAELQSVFIDAFEGGAGVLPPTRKEAEVALKETKRQDFRESDEGLARYAEKAGTLYALYASLSYTVRGELVLAGRVVRDDGKAMGTARAEVKRNKEPFAQLLKPLAAELFAKLGTARLPTVKEAPTAALVPTVPVVVPPSVEPPPLPPPEPPRATGPWLPGFVIAGGGAAAALVGAIVAGTADTQLNESRLVVPREGQTPAEAAAAYHTAKGQQTAGLVVVGVGAAAAVAGAVLAYTVSPSSPSVAVVPVPGGAVLAAGGTFP